MSCKKHILVISPHADDEVLGVGGYLMHNVNIGAKVSIMFAAIGGKDQKQNQDIRIKEAEKVCSILNSDMSVLFYGKDAELDTMLKVENQGTLILLFRSIGK